MKDTIQPKTNDKGNDDKRQEQRPMTKDKDQPIINRQRQNHNQHTKIKPNIQSNTKTAKKARYRRRHDTTNFSFYKIR